MVILVTFMLFVLALFTKGWTHDLLLEAAVFLVSVKLIMLSSRINKNTELLLNSIKDLSQRPDFANSLESALPDGHQEMAS
jgi:hypothetical protein